MGEKPDHPVRQHRVRLTTLIVRPHPSDWLPLKYGKVTEFRTHQGFPDRIYPPSPMVLWRRIGGRVETMLWVVEEAWREPLGAISDESLRRIGCASPSEFRERWVAARATYFDATKNVNVFRGRPYRDTDRDSLADKLLETLYGAFLP
ncbi:MAG: hypothetical protein QOF36_2563 [Microbacteriaceae bacterium]|jgi:hypothetical protein|nr:hypothetical protein [Microbacteriaceae bacterium]